MNKMEVVLYRASYNSTQNMYAAYICVSKPFVSLINIITVICNCLQCNNDEYCTYNGRKHVNSESLDILRS